TSVTREPSFPVHLPSPFPRIAVRMRTRAFGLSPLGGVSIRTNRSSRGSTSRQICPGRILGIVSLQSREFGPMRALLTSQNLSLAVLHDARSHQPLGNLKKPVAQIGDALPAVLAAAHTHLCGISALALGSLIYPTPFHVEPLRRMLHSCNLPSRGHV